MSDVAYFHARLPLSGDGVIDFTVHVKDVHAASDQDRDFILQVIDKITAFTVSAAPEAKRPEVPAMLRGVGGRP